MQFVIETRGPDQIDDLYAMILACGEEMWLHLGLDHWRPPTPKDTYREFARARSVYAVMEEGAAIATFTLGEEMPEPYPDTCWEDASQRAIYLVKLAVHPSVQKRGLGRWCMEQIEQIARDGGYDAVRFDALTRNGPLLGFYDHLGYRRCGDMYVMDEIDRGWDIVVYEKVVGRTA